MQTKNANHGIDLFKFIFTIAVIAIHTEPFCNSNMDIHIKLLYEMLVNMAVPFYFIASGYLLENKMNGDGDANLACIQKHFMKILNLYVLWTVIYLPMTLYNFKTNGISIKYDIISFIQGLIFKGEQYNSWPLWYLLSTVYAEAIIYLLMKKNIKGKLLLVVAFLFSILSCGFDMIAHTTCDVLIFQKIGELLEYTFGNGRMFQGMIYIPIGMYLAKHSLRKKWNVAGMLVGLLIVQICDISIVKFYILILCSTCLFGIISQLRLPNSRLYIYGRKSGFIVYLIHMYVWTAYYVCVYGEKSFGMDSFVWTTIISFTISFGVIYIKENQLSKRRNKKNIC